MSREDVLVTTDWAEKNLGAEGVVFVEVDEDTTAYDGGATSPPAPSSSAGPPS